jgi:hypothetical protein
MGHTMRWGKRPKFSGELNEPIIENPWDGQIASSPQDVERIRQEALSRARKRQLLKLGKLLAFYEINSKARSRWILLSLKLACDFVPGMQILFHRRQRGRPAKWKSARGTELVEVVNRVKAERRKGVADAIRVLMKRHPGKWGSGNASDVKKTAASLQSRYYEVLRQLRPHDAAPGTSDLNEK